MVTLAPLLAGQSPASPLALATQLSTARMKAYKDLDPDWYERRLAPDYIDVSLDGTKVERAEEIKSIRAIARHGVHVFDAYATVASAQRTKTDLVVVAEAVRKQEPLGPRMRVYEIHRREESTWIFRKGTWLLQRTKELSLSTTLNGKPWPS